MHGTNKIHYDKLVLNVNESWVFWDRESTVHPPPRLHSLNLLTGYRGIGGVLILCFSVFTGFLVLMDHGEGVAFETVRCKEGEQV